MYSATIERVIGNLNLDGFLCLNLGAEAKDHRQPRPTLYHDQASAESWAVSNPLYIYIQILSSIISHQTPTQYRICRSTTMSIPKTLSRTPTMVSDQSETVTKAKPAPSSDSARRGSDESNIHPEKVVKPGTPQQGMVAPLQLSRWRFWAIFISLMISIFLFALGMFSILSVHYILTCRPTYPRYCHSQNHRSLQLPYRIIMARLRFLVRPPPPPSYFD